MKKPRLILKLLPVFAVAFLLTTSCDSNSDEIIEDVNVVSTPETSTTVNDDETPDTSSNTDPELETTTEPENTTTTPEVITTEAQSDELVGPYNICNLGASNDNRVNDIANPINKGTIDDRSCYADYSESVINGTTWGVYNITDGSNHLDTNGLQPRIERSFARSNANIGSFVEFKGTVRILETGSTGNRGTDGTYIMQAKGKHTGGGGSPDPAICLYLAKPVYGTNSEGKRVQVSFDIFREQINFRGGSGSRGRQVVFLKNVKKNVPTAIELKVGFRMDPNDATKKIHYANAKIGDEIFNWNIPEPNKGTQSGIRYGAYRVRGGRAQIRWTNTTFVRKNN